MVQGRREYFPKLHASNSPSQTAHLVIVSYSFGLVSFSFNVVSYFLGMVLYSFSMVPYSFGMASYSFAGKMGR